ncbi:MAG TPA: hypothetical protein EYQ44_02155 [Porticoccaceae bacterium]|nr:hypothetical protein [Porticoccaceae bacterium]HIK80761.1 hypothetical protein [Porticoccaceae bacterium]
MAVYKSILIVLALVGFTTLGAYGADEALDLNAHKDKAPYWQSQGALKGLVDNSATRPDVQSSVVFSLDEDGFRAELQKSYKYTYSQSVVYFPNTSGQMMPFLVTEKSNFSSVLAAKFPNITAYSGIALNNPDVKVRFSMSPDGIEAMIEGDQGPEKTTIRKLSRDADSYVVFTKLDLMKTRNPFSCSTPVPSKAAKTPRFNLKNENFNRTSFSNESFLSKYRLAISASSQYSDYYGGTLEGALAGINTTLTGLNFIFETDLGVTFELVDDNDLIIYTDAESDPYTDDLNGLNGELQSNLDSVIGADNYDIGHIFSSFGAGMSGNAGAIGAVCNDSNKGSAYSDWAQPEGSVFTNLVAHEMGHQVGANHTFSMRTESTGANVEPGSGTTIMSYAGITGPDDVATLADDYYHHVSIQQSWAYLQGQACHVNSANENSVPSVTAIPDYTVPVKTPFVLIGDGTDADVEDVLTYTWEQIDDGLVTSDVFGPENTQGANFRSLAPTMSSIRYFPLLSSVLSGNLTQQDPDTTSTWETLPNVPRELNFALTVRDNAEGGGGVASELVKVTVVDNDGAFSIISQGSGQLYLTGSTQTITWRVAGTNVSPILAELVDITMSVDGGLTYPYTLAENVNNDGSHAVAMPDVVTSTARVRVEPTDNVFYAINARDFGITRDDIVLTYSELDYAVCNNQSTSASLTYETSSAYTDTAIFSSLNAPSGLAVGFSPVSASVNNTPIDVTFSAATDIVPNTYPVEVIATSDIRTQSVTLNVSAYSSIFTPVTLTLPADQSVLSDLATKLQWQKQNNAVSYKVEVATDQSFSEIFLSSTVDTNFTSVTGMQRETNYYWRVTPINSCGVADAGTVYTFTTPNLFQAQNLPVMIRSDEPTSVSSTISISENLVITDVNVGVDVSHTYVGELTLILTSPTGMSITLLQDVCVNEDYSSGSDINAVFDDEGSDLECGLSSPVVSGTLRPQIGSLDTFNDQSTQGDWVLSITDIYAGDGGSLDNFTLEMSTDGAYVNRAPIALPQSAKATPQNAIEVALEAIDPEKQPLTYSLVDAPGRGQLSVLAPSLLGDTHTNGGAREVAVSSDYAYVADYASGLAIIDVSDPTNPGMPVYMDTTGEARGVAVRGNYAYVADGPSGLHIIDVSDPSSPSLLSTFDTNGYASDVTLSADGAKAYVADGSSGLHIVSVSDSANPSSWGLFNTGGEALGIALSSDSSKAYVANGESGILIVDVSDASNLNSIGSLEFANNVASGVALSADGATAYLANGPTGLQIIDVSYAFTPVLLGSLDTAGSAVDVVLAADGEMAYIADSDSGLQIIDIESSSNPKLLGSFRVNFEIPSSASGVALSTDGTKAYVANDIIGLQIIDVAPTVFIAGDVIPQSVDYTHTSDDVIADAATDSFTFKVNDGALDSNVAAVDIWMDSLSNDGTWTYLEFLDGSLTITGCVGTCATNLVIPETIDGIAVTVIGEGAFADSGITLATIPNSVTTIGNYAFTTNVLTSVTFGNSVTVIGTNAFAYNKLFAVSFLGDRPSLASDSFFGNRALTHVSYCDEKSGWPGASISVGSTDVDPIEDCDSVNNNTAALSQLLAAANSGDASGITVTDLNAIIGLTHVDANNLTVYQTAIELLAGGTNLDQLKEIQSLIDSVNIAITSCSSTVYFVSVTSGDWPGEVSWFLEDASGAALYEGIAPFNTLICLRDARYTLRMSDSYGDGWNGAKFSVLTTAGDIVITRTLVSGSQGTAAINVGDYPNEGPVANAQTVTLVEKIPTSITLSGTDPENDDLTYYLDSEPTQGSFTVFNPNSLGSVATDSIAINVVISGDGNTAFVADYEGGLQIIDISDASNPAVLSTFNTDGLAYNVAISGDGNTAYVADEEFGLQIVDVSDRSNPSLLSAFDTEGYAIGVALSSNEAIAYVADVHSLQIIDIGNPQSPNLLGSFSTSGAAYGVTISADENSAYIAVDSAGLEIVDITNSADPVLVSTLDTPGLARAVQLSNDGKTAYVTDDYSGLQIIDINDPANPDLLSNFDTEGDSWGLTLSSDGNFAYVADYYSLQVIDISDKASPRTMGEFSTAGPARGVALSVDGNTAYIAEGSGLQIIDATISNLAIGDEMPQVVTYTSTVADATTDSFSFTVNDARLDSTPATVDVIILPDNDGDGIANINDLDDDNDGMPDDFEIANGFDPFDSTDGAEDLDNDGVSNVQEYINGTDVSVDDYGPVLVIPENMVVSATGFLTDVDLGMATATDRAPTNPDVTSNLTGPFESGAYEVVWSAEDSLGNQSQATQLLSVVPLVSLGLPFSVGEEGDYEVSVSLSGDAAEYPVIIPVQLSGTAVEVDDYTTNLEGSLTINQGRSVSMTISIVQDAIAESDETITVTLPDTFIASEDCGVISICNAVVGSASSQKIIISESNLPPMLELRAGQANSVGPMITRDGGQVTITAIIKDGNYSDNHTLDWGAALSALPNSATDAAGNLTFDPATLDLGALTVSGLVRDNGNPQLSLSNSVVMAVLETLTPLAVEQDTDGDGVSDAAEGWGDSDHDGIPDYQDAIAELYMLPLNVNSTNLIQSENGTSIRLGGRAISQGDYDLSLTEEELSVSGDSYYDFPDGLIDYRLMGAEPGYSYSLVLPLSFHLGPRDVVKKYVDETLGWQLFVEDAANSVASVVASDGTCPEPGSEVYIQGLTEGANCIQLTVEDGGPNDADGQANGTLVDPVGAAVKYLGTPSDGSTVSLSDNEITANGSDSATVTVTAYDAQGVTLEDMTVDATASLSGVTVSSFAEQGDGVYTATVTANNTSGSAILNVTVSNGAESINLTSEAITVVSPPAPPAPTPSSGGGGGCVVAVDGSSDASMPLLLMIAGLLLMRRRYLYR